MFKWITGSNYINNTIIINKQKEKAIVIQLNATTN